MTAFFLDIDGLVFNAQHITYVTCRELAGCHTAYRIQVVSQADRYDCDSIFKTKKECLKAIHESLLEPGLKIADEKQEGERDLVFFVNKAKERSLEKTQHAYNLPEGVSEDDIDFYGNNDEYDWDEEDLIEPDE